MVVELNNKLLGFNRQADYGTNMIHMIVRQQKTTRKKRCNVIDWLIQLDD